MPRCKCIVRWSNMLAHDCIKRNNGGTVRETRRPVVCQRNPVAVETEWQSRVLSPFLVVLSHSKSFYSMPCSSSFQAAPPANNQDLCFCVCVCAFLCARLNNMSHFLFVCIMHNVCALALCKCTVRAGVPLCFSPVCWVSHCWHTERSETCY